MNYLLLLPLLCLTLKGVGQELPGLILHSKMENSCQFTDEISGSPAHGVMIDISLTTNRNNTPNTALAFDQNTSYITLGAVDKLKLPGDKSIFFWIKPAITGTDRTGSIFSYGNALTIGYQEQSSVPKLYISFGNTLYLQSNLSTEWQAVTITFSKDYSSAKSKASLYIDQIFKAEAEQIKTTQNFSSSLAIMGASNPASPINGFRGSLDDFKIYDRALTAPEILKAVPPFTLESFTGKRINGIVQLNWTTTIEGEVSHFDLQKSVDRIIFRTISKTLAGKYNYQVADKNASANIDTWYRLQIVNKDGQSAYSEVIEVRRDSSSITSGIIMFPNPAISTINFRGAIEHHIINIVSITGMLVKQQQLTSKINIADIRPGLYYIVIYDDMGNKKMVSKFIKINDR